VVKRYIPTPYRDSNPHEEEVGQKIFDVSRKIFGSKWEKVTGDSSAQ